jgi:hypothetical protein
MTRLMFTALLCALGTAQASSQNVVSQQFLELDDDLRNAAFTLMLRDSNRKCNQVIRTLFNGTVLGVTCGKKASNSGIRARTRARVF